MYALLQSAAISGKRGSIPVAIGKLGVALGVAVGCAVPAAIPFLLPAVCVGLAVADSKIKQYERIVEEEEAELRRRARR